MKGSVNLEFRDEDLRRFAEDVMRRGALHLVGELFKQVINDPRLAHLAKEALRNGVEIGREGRGPFMYPDEVIPAVMRRRRGVPFQYPNDMPRGPSPYPPAGAAPPPPPPSPQKPQRCVHVEANPYQEEGWICHECQIYNGIHRPACRQCAHERCDDIVGPRDEAPPNVPSGSA